MTQRLFWWGIAALMVICMLLGMRSCGRVTSPPPVAQAPAEAQPATPAAEAERDAQAARRRAEIAQHDAAIQAAVSTLHRYLAALGGGDRAAADAFWTDGHAPERSGEADLRHLTGLRGLRSENDQPTALDADPVPSALQIPVHLRIGFEQGPVRRYQGWYRLRRTLADGHWEITSASVDAAAAPQ